MRHRSRDVGSAARFGEDPFDRSASSSSKKIGDRQRRHRPSTSKASRLSSAAGGSDGDQDQVYFDIEVEGHELGRLTFDLIDESVLPLHMNNLKKLCTGERRSIDPLAHYDGCTFDYSPSYIEDGSARYRWGHVMRGRGRNAVGDPSKTISDPASVRECAHDCFGGTYYGERYREVDVLGSSGPTHVTHSRAGVWN